MKKKIKARVIYEVEVEIEVDSDWDQATQDAELIAAADALLMEPEPSVIRF